MKIMNGVCEVTIIIYITMHYRSIAVHFLSPSFEVDRCNILKKAATEKI